MSRSHRSRTVLAAVWLVMALVVALPAGAVITKEGCRVRTVTKKQAEEQHWTVSWDGACDKETGAFGHGWLLVDDADGAPIVSYQGLMLEGYYHGHGKLTRPNGSGWEGEFNRGTLAAGKMFSAGGVLAFEGKFGTDSNGSATFGEGVVHFGDGEYLVGEFDPVPTVNKDSGVGVRHAVLYDRSGKIRYWMVGASRYDSETKYQNAIAAAAVNAKAVEAATREAQYQQTLASLGGGPPRKPDPEDQAALQRLNGVLSQIAAGGIPKDSAQQIALLSQLSGATPIRSTNGTPSSVGTPVAGPSLRAPTTRNGWTCNGLGACAIPVSEIQGIATESAECPQVVFSAIQFRGGGQDGKFYFTHRHEFWSKDQQLYAQAKQMYSEQSRYLPDDMKNERTRYFAAFECWQRVGYKIDASSLWISQKKTHEPSPAFVERAIAEKRLAEPDGDRIASGIGYGFIARQELDEFMRAQYDDRDLDPMLVWDDRRPLHPRKAGSVCERELADRGRLGDYLIISDGWILRRQSSLQMDLRRMREAKPGLDAAFAHIAQDYRETAVEGFYKPLAALECLERNGWPYTAENTYFVVYYSGGGRST